MHENGCNAQNIDDIDGEHVTHEVVVQDIEEQVEEHVITSIEDQNQFAPLKYSVSQLDTHEIIIETSR